MNRWTCIDELRELDAPEPGHEVTADDEFVALLGLAGELAGFDGVADPRIEVLADGHRAGGGRQPLLAFVKPLLELAAHLGLDAPGDLGPGPGGRVRPGGVDRPTARRPRPR
jgi:hypothetical protein